MHRDFKWNKGSAYDVMFMPLQLALSLNGENGKSFSRVLCNSRERRCSKSMWSEFMCLIDQKCLQPPSRTHELHVLAQLHAFITCRHCALLKFLMRLLPSSIVIILPLHRLLRSSQSSPSSQPQPLLDLYAVKISTKFARGNHHSTIRAGERL